MPENVKQNKTKKKKEKRPDILRNSNIVRIFSSKDVYPFLILCLMIFATKQNCSGNLFFKKFCKMFNNFFSLLFNNLNNPDTCALNNNNNDDDNNRQIFFFPKNKTKFTHKTFDKISRVKFNEKKIMIT